MIADALQPQAVHEVQNVVKEGAHVEPVVVAQTAIGMMAVCWEIEKSLPLEGMTKVRLLAIPMISEQR